MQEKKKNNNNRAVIIAKRVSLILYIAQLVKWIIYFLFQVHDKD
jgi:hypothetical protein